MQNKALISVVVPIYNVEQYLEKCVYSLINQTYKNLEIILVDDGSKDNSGKLADELALKDIRIKVYHKKNGGLSDARNYGVEKANGEYIGFVDSDDYIHKDMYQHLYDVISKEGADVSECNFTFVYGEKEKLQYEDEYYLVLNREGYLKEYLTMDKLYGATCCRLIKSDVAKKLTFPVGKIYEDAYYALDLIKEVDKYVITNKPYYYYYIRENSITNERFNERQLTIIDVISDFKDYTYKNYPNLKNEANNREMYSYFGIMNQIVMLENYRDNEHFKNIRRYFRKNLFSIIKNPVISNKRKLSVILLVLNVNLYKKVLINYMNELRQG